jgi:hypothetical protein
VHHGIKGLVLPCLTALAAQSSPQCSRSHTHTAAILLNWKYWLIPWFPAMGPSSFKSHAKCKGRSTPFPVRALGGAVVCVVGDLLFLFWVVEWPVYVWKKMCARERVVISMNGLIIVFGLLLKFMLYCTISSVATLLLSYSTPAKFPQLQLLQNKLQSLSTSLSSTLHHLLFLLFDHTFFHLYYCRINYNFNYVSIILLYSPLPSTCTFSPSLHCYFLFFIICSTFYQSLLSFYFITFCSTLYSVPSISVFSPLLLPVRLGSSIGYLNATKAVYKESINANVLLAEHSFFFTGSVSWPEEEVTIPVTEFCFQIIFIFYLCV